MSQRKAWLLFGLIVVVGVALSLAEGEGVDWLSDKLFPNRKPEN